MLEPTGTATPPSGDAAASSDQASVPADGARPSDGQIDETVLCPYLRTDDGDWRAAWAYREHRCGAVEPPAPLAGEKQRRLCLVSAHLGCATYQAAERTALPTRSDRSGAVGGAVVGAPRWPIPVTAPVVLDRSGRSPLDWRPDRSIAQVALVALMIAAFGMLALARFSTPGGPGGPSGGSPSPAGSAAPSSASPAADTYRVKAGDTLSDIAARYGTTVAVLQELNGIEDPSKLRVGQLLELPQPVPTPGGSPNASPNVSPSGPADASP